MLCIDADSKKYIYDCVSNVCVTVSEVVGNLSCSGLDWDSVYMEWEPPVYPHGQILFYFIRTADQEEKVYPLIVTHTLTHTLSSLKPNSFYIISVAAVNSAGTGEDANCTAHTAPESGTIQWVMVVF